MCLTYGHGNFLCHIERRNIYVILCGSQGNCVITEGSFKAIEAEENKAINICKEREEATGRR